MPFLLLFSSLKSQYFEKRLKQKFFSYQYVLKYFKVHMWQLVHFLGGKTPRIEKLHIYSNYMLEVVANLILTQQIP